MQLYSLKKINREIVLFIFLFPVILLFISIIDIENHNKLANLTRQYTQEQMPEIKKKIFNTNPIEEEYILTKLNQSTKSTNASKNYINTKVKPENNFQYLPNQLLIKIENSKFNSISAIKNMLNDEKNINITKIPYLSDWYKITVQDYIDYSDIVTINCLSNIQNLDTKENTTISDYKNKCQSVYDINIKTKRIKSKLNSSKIGFVENVKVIYSYVNNQPFMWNIKNIGQEYPGIGFDANGNIYISMYTGMHGNDINIETIWQSGNKGANVIVAVVDGGVDYSHPDLTNNIWENIYEIPDNGIDDDDNGYIDDVYGYDFSSIDYCEDGPDNIDCEEVDAGNDNNPMDYRGHGTHVAGTIAATLQNLNENIVGVAPESKIMPVRFINSLGFGVDSDAASSIIYAVDNGADIINCSWGGSNSEIIADAILYAKSKNVKVVFAAGNDTSNEFVNTFSGNEDTIDDVIIVGSINANNQISNFSNYGYLIDIFAPGEDILSLASSQGVSYPELIYNGDYILSGTSMSAPNVSGVIALMESKYKMENSGQRIHPEIVKTRLHSSAVDMLDDGYDFTSSYGKIDATKAVESNLNIWAQIESPKKYAYVSDSLETIISVYGTNLTSWALEVSEINSTNWIIAYSGTESIDKLSLNINTSQFENGDYYLRLRYSVGNENSYIYRRFSKSEYLDYQMNANYYFNNNSYIPDKSKIYNFSDGEKLLQHGNTIYLSSKSVTEWNPIINIPNNSKVSGSTVDNDDSILISCNDGIYISTDRSTSWIKIFDSNVYLSHYINHDVYLNDIIGGDIIKHENSITAIFSVVNKNLEHVNFFGLDYISTILQDAGSRFVVYQSDDLGATWYEISSQFTIITDIDNLEYPVSDIKKTSLVGNDSYLIASSIGSEFEAQGYVSIDGIYIKRGNGTYSQIVLPRFNYNNIEYLPLTINNIFVDSNGTRYILVYDNRYDISFLYKSTDNGISWIPEYLDITFVYDLGEIEIDNNKFLAYTKFNDLMESKWLLKVRNLNSTKWAYYGSNLSGAFIEISDNNLAITELGYLYKIGEIKVEGDFSYAYEYHNQNNIIIEPERKYTLNIGTYFPNDQVTNIELITKPINSVEINHSQLEWDVSSGGKRIDRAIVLTENSKGKTINILEYSIDNKPDMYVPSKVKIVTGKDNIINMIANDKDSEHVQFDVYGIIPGTYIDMQNHNLQINPDQSLLGNIYNITIVPVSGYYVNGNPKYIEIEIVDNWNNTNITGQVFNDLNRNGIKDNAHIENEIYNTEVSLSIIHGLEDKQLLSETLLPNSSKFEFFPQVVGEYELEVKDLNERYPIISKNISIQQGDNITNDIGLIDINEALTDLQIEASLNASEYSFGEVFVINGEINNLGSGKAYDLIMNLSFNGVSQINSATINEGECILEEDGLKCSLVILPSNSKTNFQISGVVGESPIISINGEVSNFVYENNFENNSISLESSASPLDYSDIKLDLISQTGDNSSMSQKTVKILLKNIGTIKSEKILLNIQIPYSSIITNTPAYCQTNSVDFSCSISPLEANEELKIEFYYYLDDYGDFMWKIESISLNDINLDNNIIEFTDKITDSNLLLFVSKDGNDDNNGSQEKPLLTINKALQICNISSSSSESCSIRVTSGIYRENILVKSNIRLRGGYCIDDKWSRDLESCKTIIQGGVLVPDPKTYTDSSISIEKNINKRGVITIKGSDILINGLIVSNQNSMNMPLVVTYSQSITLSKLLFTNNHQVKTDPDSASLYIGNSSDINIDKITVSNNIDNGINIKSSSSINITNSIITNNSFTGIKGYRSKIDLNYSNIYGNRINYNGFSLGGNTISIDPKFLTTLDSNTIDYFRYMKGTECASAGRFSYLGALKPLK